MTQVCESIFVAVLSDIFIGFHGLICDFEAYSFNLLNCSIEV